MPDSAFMETGALPNLDQRLRARLKPPGTPLMRQTWRDLLFAHWECDPQALEQLLPPGLHLDTYDGRAYVGIIPFFMVNVHPSFFPPIPGWSNFLETNVRTYVFDERGTPGVWFFSLDCNRRLAVKGARAFYFLPYHHATMSAEIERGGLIRYDCERDNSGLRAHFEYQSASKPLEADLESLEFFLVERYWLFSHKEGRLYRAKVYHRPYPLMKASHLQIDHTMFRMNGLPEPISELSHVVMSAGVTVDVYSLEKATQ